MKDATDHYEEVYYDLAQWYPEEQSWVPKGYEETWDRIKERYSTKLQFSSTPLRVILVEKSVTHTDLTEQMQRELSL